MGFSIGGGGKGLERNIIDGLPNLESGGMITCGEEGCSKVLRR